MIFFENVAVLKEYNIPCHYEAKHLPTHAKSIRKLQAKKLEIMKQVWNLKGITLRGKKTIG